MVKGCLPQTHIEDLLRGVHRCLSLLAIQAMTGSLDIYRLTFAAPVKAVGLGPVRFGVSSGVNKLAKCYECVASNTSHRIRRIEYVVSNAHTGND